MELYNFMSWMVLDILKYFHSEYSGKRDVTLIFHMSQQHISNNQITTTHNNFRSPR
jgi:hypothetical protein